jgi:peptidoglycan hydrolase CwlO-like protein
VATSKLLKDTRNLLRQTKEEMSKHQNANAAEMAALKEEVSQLKDANAVEMATMKEDVSQLKDATRAEIAALKEEVSQLKNATAQTAVATTKQHPSKFKVFLKSARARSSPARSPSRIAARRSPAVQRRTLASQ